MFYENPHASTVVALTAQSWLPMQTCSDWEKERELSVPIFTQLPYASHAIPNSIKERIYPKPRGRRCG